MSHRDILQEPFTGAERDETRQPRKLVSNTGAVELKQPASRMPCVARAMLRFRHHSTLPQKRFTDRPTMSIVHGINSVGKDRRCTCLALEQKCCSTHGIWRPSAAQAGLPWLLSNHHFDGCCIIITRNEATHWMCTESSRLNSTTCLPINSSHNQPGQAIHHPPNIWRIYLVPHYSATLFSAPAGS